MARLARLKVEMEYMFITNGIEAVVEVDITRELVGDHGSQHWV